MNWTEIYPKFIKQTNTIFIDILSASATYLSCITCKLWNDPNMQIWSKFLMRNRRGCDRMVFDLQLPMQSVPITTNVVSSNPYQARCTQYNIMQYSVSVTCRR